MASVIRDPGGLKRVQWCVGDGDRRTLRLGNVSVRQAEAVRIRVEQVLVEGIGRAIRVQSLNFEIIGVIGEPIRRRHPQPSPGIHVAIRGENRVAGARVNLDDVVILFVPAKITCAIRCLGPLGGVEKAPILPVDVKMIKVSAFGRVALGQLRVA